MLAQALERDWATMPDEILFRLLEKIRRMGDTTTNGKRASNLASDPETEER